MVNYAENDSRGNAEANFQVISEQEFQLSGQDAQGYRKKKVADIEIPQ